MSANTVVIVVLMVALAAAIGALVHVLFLRDNLLQVVDVVWYFATQRRYEQTPEVRIELIKRAIIAKQGEVKS